jgi:hypothetical protein
MSSSHPHSLDCGGRSCQNCGKCREWKWDKGVSGCCGIGGTKDSWKRYGANCRYGSGTVYHDVLRDSYHHSLCVCEKRRKK